jgi:hypothetical protein
MFLTNQFAPYLALRFGVDAKTVFFSVAKLGFEHNVDLYTVYRPAVGIRKHQNIASGRLVWCLPSRGGDALIS